MPILIPLVFAVWGLHALRGIQQGGLFARLHASNIAGDWETALRQLRTHKVLGLFDLPATERLVIETHALLGLGRIDEARRLLETFGRSPMPRQMWWFWTNQIINELITTGKYEEALAIAPFAKVDTRFDPMAEGVNLTLMLINLAEAEYNLGRWEAALQRMVGLDDLAKKGAITRAGLMLQRAWILAHLGRGAEAWSCAELVSPEDLPPDYRTERHYSRAAAHLACGRPRLARAEIEGGLAIAHRTSSERNGWYFLARVAAAEEQWSEAADWCAKAAEHRFQHQGGDGLLLWGDVLMKLDRNKEARAAWHLAIDRDAESESAAIAARRLDGSQAATV